MTRRTWLAIAGVVLTISASLLVLRPNPDARISRENYERIKEDMTKAEVEAILGPPGDYRSMPVDYTLNLADGFCEGPDSRSYSVENHSWKGDRSTISVDYNYLGKVIHSHRADVLEPTPGPLNVLVWRTKRQWRRWFPE
jgi:hypothetical protein